MKEVGVSASRCAVACMLVTVVLLGFLPSPSICVAGEEADRHETESVLDDRLSDDVLSDELVDVLVKYDSRIS